MFSVKVALIFVVGINASPRQGSNKYTYNVVSNPTSGTKSVYQPSYFYKPAYEEALKPYEYSYQVKDEYSGNDFEASESSDGQKVQGYYSVLLPDGRRQRVEYTADDANGYNADVSYEGSAAVYHISKFNDSPKNSAPSTASKSAPTPTTTFIRPSISYTTTTQAPTPKTETNAVKKNQRPNKYVTYVRRQSGYAPTTSAPLPEIESNEINVATFPEQDKIPARRYGYTILNRNSKFSKYPTLYHPQV